MARGLIDTRVWISAELGRSVDHSPAPRRGPRVCNHHRRTSGRGAIGLNSTSRARRLDTLQTAVDVEPLTVDVRAAQVWAELRARLHEAGRRINVNDLWIAAVAVANNVPVVTPGRRLRRTRRAGAAPDRQGLTSLQRVADSPMADIGAWLIL